MRLYVGCETDHGDGPAGSGKFGESDHNGWFRCCQTLAGPRAAVPWQLDNALYAQNNGPVEPAQGHKVSSSSEGKELNGTHTGSIG